MKIGIDARMYGVGHTGIGRYVQNLILELAKIDRNNQYYLFGGDELREEIKKYPNFHFVKLNSPIYSIQEQIVNPFIFSRYKLDLLHIPHFNAPVFYPGKIVVTIHDLIKHLSTGKETTNLNSFQYYIKNLGYKLVVWLVVKKAVKIITPSAYWRDYLTDYYSLDNKKINVTYYAVDHSGLVKVKTKENPGVVLDRYGLSKPYLIYTGNLYPHKNVPFLINSVIEFNRQHNHKLQLAIVCARGLFAQRISKTESIRYLGYVPDEDLKVLYKQALALVQPSFIEGFGLTGLEAMSVGLPVLSSNSTCLPEIYADAALYFDPHNEEELIGRLNEIFTDTNLVKKLIREGYERVAEFSWLKTAKETLKIYQKVVTQ